MQPLKSLVALKAGCSTPGRALNHFWWCQLDCSVHVSLWGCDMQACPEPALDVAQQQNFYREPLHAAPCVLGA